VLLIILLIMALTIMPVACGVEEAQQSTPTPTPAATITTPAPDEVVTFNNDRLEAAVRHLIKKKTGDIHASDLEGLTELSISPHGNMTDLTGLEYCTSLTYLKLELNQVGDISPLYNLTNLRVLKLRDNRISDITPLSNLINLTELRLENNMVSDITPLSNLTGLSRLNLNRNQISDISPLINNGGLGEGDLLGLAFNPLSKTAMTVHIPRLEQRGVILVPPETYTSSPSYVKISVSPGDIYVDVGEQIEVFCSQLLAVIKPANMTSVELVMFDSDDVLLRKQPMQFLYGRYTEASTTYIIRGDEAYYKLLISFDFGISEPEHFSDYTVDAFSIYQ